MFDKVVMVSAKRNQVTEIVCRFPITVEFMVGLNVMNLRPLASAPIYRAFSPVPPQHYLAYRLPVGASMSRASINKFPCGFVTALQRAIDTIDMPPSDKRFATPGAYDSYFMDTMLLLMLLSALGSAIFCPTIGSDDFKFCVASGANSHIPFAAFLPEAFARAIWLIVVFVGNGKHLPAIPTLARCGFIRVTLLAWYMLLGASPRAITILKVALLKLYAATDTNLQPALPHRDSMTTLGAKSFVAVLGVIKRLLTNRTGFHSILVNAISHGMCSQGGTRAAFSRSYALGHSYIIPQIEGVV